MNDWKIEEMSELIKQMRQVAEELKEKSGNIQAVERNLDRILTNIKMLVIYLLFRCQWLKIRF